MCRRFRTERGGGSNGWGSNDGGGVGPVSEATAGLGPGQGRNAERGGEVTTAGSGFCVRVTGMSCDVDVSSAGKRKADDADADVPENDGSTRTQIPNCNHTPMLFFVMLS